jgi:F-type H+-transporting ATPase subunit b
MLKKLHILALLGALATLSLLGQTLAEAPHATPAHPGPEAHALDAHDPHADPGGAEAHEQPGLLSVDYGSAVWTIVLFLVLLTILGKFVWPHVLKGLQDRENKLRQDLEHAEAAAKQAQATLNQYQAKLTQANEEVRRLIEQGREDAQKIAAQLRQQAQAEIDQARQRAQSDIRVAKEQALNEIYEQAAELATTAAGRILQRQMNAEDHRRLVQESLAQLSQQTT